MQPASSGERSGTALLMTVSHGLMLYLWMAWRFHDGAVFYPTGFADIGPFFASMWDQIVTYAAPSWSVFGMYWAFLLVEGLMAAYLPGIEIKGLPIPSRGGKQLVYRCNAISAWWITLAAVAVLHFTGVFPLQTLFDRFGSFMIVSMISANVVAFAVYFGAKATGTAERMTGKFLLRLLHGGLGQSADRAPRPQDVGRGPRVLVDALSSDSERSRPSVRDIRRGPPPR